MNSEGSQTSSLKSRFWRDENFFKSSFCAEFFAARPADQTIRFSSMDDIFLKISFCADFCVMISIEIQRIGGTSE